MSMVAAIWRGQEGGSQGVSRGALPLLLTTRLEYWLLPQSPQPELPSTRPEPPWSPEASRCGQARAVPSTQLLGPLPVPPLGE